MSNDKKKSFRIATWNLDHPELGNRFPEQMKKLAEISADILILTETSPEADLSHMGYMGVSSLPYRPKKKSKRERNSSAIWSKWPIACALSTYDDETTTCAKIKAPFGDILVYGTILTWKMDRWPDDTGAHWSLHDKEIERQGGDWNRIQDSFPDERQGGDWNRIRSLFPDIPFVVAGDFNQARDGKGTYYSPKGIGLLNTALERNNLTCLTDMDFGHDGQLTVNPFDDSKSYRHSVDHICVTEGRFDIKKVWAWDHFTDIQELSDHNGVCVDLVPRSEWNE